MLRLSFTFFLLIFISIKGIAQQWLGISGSNYAGTNAAYINPANIVDSRYKIFINLGSNDIFINNNYVKWNAPFSMLQLVTNSVPKEYKSDNNKVLVKEEYLIADNSSNVKHLNILDDLRGPSILFNLNDRQSIALLSRLRTGLNFTGVSSQFANFIRLGIQNTEVQNQAVSFQKSAFNVNSYTEFGFSFGQVIQDDDESLIKIGVTAKRLVGLYSAHLIIDNMNYQIVDNPANPQEQIFAINNIAGDFGYTKDAAFNNAALSPNWVLGNLAAGNGWGMDIGLVYELRSDTRKITYREKGVLKLDPSKNKYKFRFSVSLLDIGRLKYANPDFVKNWQSRINNKSIYSNDFKDVQKIDESFQQLNNTFTLSNSQALPFFNSSLPSSLNVNVDYHYKKNIYINYNWSQSLTSEQSIGFKTPSLLAVIPRWETKWLEFAIPLALLDNYSTFTFGLAARLGPIFIGSDNIIGALNIGKTRGLDLYFGATIPIFNKAPYSQNACFYEKPDRRSLKETLMFWKKRS